VQYNYIIEGKKLGSSSPILRRSTSFKFDINQMNKKIKLKFREQMELGTWFLVYRCTDLSSSEPDHKHDFTKLKSAERALH
jgi:hypothetical protein